MSFYQMMQMGAAQLKPLIKKENNKKIRNKYISALIAKDILCIVFCLLVITMFSNIFGEENSTVGVVTVISILTYRLSNLGFNTKQSAITMLGIFAIFIVGPYLAVSFNPVVGFVINLVSLLAIIVLSGHNLILCNHTILVLSYLLLYGYEVSSVESYASRAIGLAIGGVIVTAILYIKNRKRDFKANFKDVINGFKLNDEKTQWQIKLALGISLGMLITELLHIPRSMWIGLGCLSLIPPDKANIGDRCIKRPIYALIGCVLFIMLYIGLPEDMRGLIGIIGGLMVGLSATYKWNTVFNSFGALIPALPMMGIGGAIGLRIVGVLGTSVYVKIFDTVLNAIFNKIGDKASTENLTNKVA